MSSWVGCPFGCPGGGGGGGCLVWGRGDYHKECRCVVGVFFWEGGLLSGFGRVIEECGVRIAGCVWMWRMGVGRLVVFAREGGWPFGWLSGSVAGVGLGEGGRVWCECGGSVV